MAYKSARYSWKVHFNVEHYHQMLLEDQARVAITHKPYLEVRDKLVRFVLDKGRLLKMSLKTLHLAVFVLDEFCERSQENFIERDEYLVTACCLLIAAKSGELDERIPFISKLKKYTGLENSVKSFKEVEVLVAQTLDWNLQRITFYSFVEYYLTAGMLCPTDKLSKRIIQSLTTSGVEDTVRLLAKEEQTRRRQTPESIDPESSSSHDSDSGEGLIALANVTSKIRSDVIKVFELYARDLCNLILREFPYWGYEKNAIGLAVLLYTRSTLLEPSSAWNPRSRDLSGLNFSDIKQVYLKIDEFISSGSPEIVAKKKEKNHNDLASILTDISPKKSSSKVTNNIQRIPLQKANSSVLGEKKNTNSNVKNSSTSKPTKIASFTNFQSLVNEVTLKRPSDKSNPASSSKKPINRAESLKEGAENRALFLK